MTNTQIGMYNVVRVTKKYGQVSQRLLFSIKVNPGTDQTYEIMRSLWL